MSLIDPTKIRDELDAQLATLIGLPYSDPTRSALKDGSWTALANVLDLVVDGGTGEAETFPGLATLGSILTTTGDLVGYSSAPVRIPVGAAPDGYVLTRDSGAAAGVSWQAGSGGSIPWTPAASSLAGWDGATAATTYLVSSFATASALSSHVTDSGNPHSVTAAQAGAQPLDADLTALAALSTTGLVERTGAGTFATGLAEAAVMALDGSRVWTGAHNAGAYDLANVGDLTANGLNVSATGVPAYPYRLQIGGTIQSYGSLSHYGSYQIKNISPADVYYYLDQFDPTDTVVDYRFMATHDRGTAAMYYTGLTTSSALLWRFDLVPFAGTEACGWQYGRNTNTTGWVYVRYFVPGSSTAQHTLNLNSDLVSYFCANDGRLAVGGISLDSAYIFGTHGSTWVDGHLDATGAISSGGLRVPRTTAETSDPTSSDDTGSGWEVGDTWINTARGRVHTCTDATASAAVWECRGPTFERVQGADQTLTSPDLLELPTAVATPPGFTWTASAPNYYATVSDAGTYEITFNVAVKFVSSAVRSSVEARIEVDTTGTGSSWSTLGGTRGLMYQRGYTNNGASCGARREVTLPAGSLVRVYLETVAGTSVSAAMADGCTLSIRKVRT